MVLGGSRWRTWWIEGMVDEEWGGCDVDGMGGWEMMRKRKAPLPSLPAPGRPTVRLPFSLLFLSLPFNLFPPSLSLLLPSLPFPYSLHCIPPSDRHGIRSNSYVMNRKCSSRASRNTLSERWNSRGTIIFGKWIAGSPRWEKESSKLIVCSHNQCVVDTWQLDYKTTNTVDET